MSKHTKGPWMVFNKTTILAGPFPADMNTYFDTRPMSLTVAEIKKKKLAHTDVLGDDKETAEANANLIAAAPDLLGACKFALDRLIKPYGPNQEGQKELAEKLLRDAIAKAEGEPQAKKSFLAEALDDIYNPKCPSCEKPTKHGEYCPECAIDAAEYAVGDR